MESPSCEHSKFLQSWPLPTDSGFYKAQAILQEILRRIHCRAQGGHNGFHRVTEIGGLFCQGAMGFGGERCLQLLQLFHNTSFPDGMCEVYQVDVTYGWAMGCVVFPSKFPWMWEVEHHKWEHSQFGVLNGNQLVLLCSFETVKSGIKKAGAQDAIGNMMPIRPATNDALPHVSGAVEVSSEALPPYQDFWFSSPWQLVRNQIGKPSLSWIAWVLHIKNTRSPWSAQVLS